MLSDMCNTMKKIILLIMFVLLVSLAYADHYDSGTTFSPPLSNITYTIVGNLTCTYLNVTDYCLIISGGPMAGSWCNNASTPSTVGLTQFNFEFRNEETDQLVTNTNISLDFISDGYVYNYSTETGTLQINLTMAANYTIRYQGAGYGRIRQYLFMLSNTSMNNLTLYMINDTSSDDLTVQVYNQQTLAEIEGGVVYLLRYFQTENAYKTVAMYTTDPGGKSYFDVDRQDEMYMFIVDYPWLTRRTQTIPDYIEADTINLYVNLLGSIGETYFNAQSIQYNVVYDNATNQFSVSYTDSELVGNNYCLYVKRYGHYSTETLNSSCTTAPTATIALSGSTHNDTFASFVVSIGDDDQLIKTFWKDYIRDKSPFGTFGVYLTSVILMLLAFVSTFHILALIFVMAGLVFSAFFGFLTVPWPFVLGAAATGVFLGVMIRVWSRR